MRRREFITLLGGAAAWPLAARAQQAGKVHRIGFLGSATAAGSAKAVASLRTGLREFGYVEGTNIGIEFRWAEGMYDRLPHLVAERTFLVRADEEQDDGRRTCIRWLHLTGR
jgi:putative ABC transport system substrate-binding protein